MLVITDHPRKKNSRFLKDFLRFSGKVSINKIAGKNIINEVIPKLILNQNMHETAAPEKNINTPFSCSIYFISK
jgi:hypothetical protein